MVMVVVVVVIVIIELHLLLFRFFFFFVFGTVVDISYFVAFLRYLFYTKDFARILSRHPLICMCVGDILPF